MDERTKILVCLGAATAANCVPCFEHYYGKANSSGITAEEIQEAVELASQVKKGAHLALKTGISQIMGEVGEVNLPCSSQSKNTCCG
jgi:alkylhydroperoxidase/carboxymuconolactone decarboxylase family protein YurZ